MTHVNGVRERSELEGFNRKRESDSQHSREIEQAARETKLMKTLGDASKTLESNKPSTEVFLFRAHVEREKKNILTGTYLAHRQRCEKYCQRVSLGRGGGKMADKGRKRSRYLQSGIDYPKNWYCCYLE